MSLSNVLYDLMFPDACPHDPNRGCALNCVGSTLPSASARVLENIAIDPSLPLAWDEAVREYLRERPYARRDIVIVAANFCPIVEADARSNGLHRDGFSGETMTAAIAAVARLLCRIYGSRPSEERRAALLPAYAMYRALRSSCDYNFCGRMTERSLTCFRSDQAIVYGGVFDISDLRWNDDGGSRILRAPLCGPCLLFAYDCDEDHRRIVDVTPSGVMVETYMTQRGHRCLVRIGHVCMFPSHPIARAMSDAAPDYIAFMLRGFCDRNGGVSHFRNRVISAANARRMGVSRRDFDRIVGEHASGYGFDQVHSRMPALPADWRQSDAAAQRRAGIQPPRPRERAWNWSRIPPDVARIMEHDLTMHLDEPNENEQPTSTAQVAQEGRTQ